MSITVRGKAPAPPRQTVITIDEHQVWDRLHQHLAELFYGAGTLKQQRERLAAIDRRCASRLIKIDDPTLRAHHGYENARGEWFTWNSEALALAIEIKSLTADLQHVAQQIHNDFMLLSPRVQAAEIECCRYAFPDALAIVHGWPEIANLEGWRRMLAVWGSNYKAVPF
jgi:hypothetical protein